ncbi:hypothetical protein ACFL60_01270 [Candidatus Omnitrophota bacterium]
MSQQELLKKVIQSLEDVEIEYMVTGSIVSSMQGEPRLTHDIDIVVSIQEKDIKKLINHFPSPRYYLDERNIVEAIKGKHFFNLIDTKLGDKVDFWILTDEPFDKSRFARKYEEDMLGFCFMVSTPEDTILAKLNWSILSGGSEKQYLDALRIFEVQYEMIDENYLSSWAKKLHVDQLLQRMKNEAEIL